MRFQIALIEQGTEYACRADESLLEGMRRLGHKGIPCGCRGGGCGVCRIQIVSGDYVSLPMGRNHISHADELHGIALACRIFPRSSLNIQVLGVLARCVESGACHGGN